MKYESYLFEWGREDGWSYPYPTPTPVDADGRVAVGVSNLEVKPYSGDWPEVTFTLTLPEGKEAWQQAWEKLEALFENDERLPREGTWPIEPGTKFELRGLGQTLRLVEE